MKNILYIFAFWLVSLGLQAQTTPTVVGNSPVGEGTTHIYSVYGRFLNGNWVVTGGTIQGTPISAANGNNMYYEVTVKWNCAVSSGNIRFNYKRPLNPNTWLFVDVPITIQPLTFTAGQISNFTNPASCAGSPATFQIGSLVDHIKTFNSTYSSILAGWTVKIYNQASGGSMIYQTTHSSASSTWNYSNTNTTLYFTITPATGCVESARYTVIFGVTTVNPATQAYSSAHFVGTSQTASIGAVVGITEYRWYNSAGTTLLQSGSSTSYSRSDLPVGVHTFLVKTAQNFGGTWCETATALPVTMTVWALPTVNSQQGLYVNGTVNQLLTVSYDYETYQWYKDNVALSGANQKSYRAKEAGSYHVVVSQNSQSRTSATTAVAVSMEDKNFIVENVVLKEGVTSLESLDSLQIGSISQNITYFDGLGRPIQQVSTQGSPTKEDIVQPIVYDEYGRVTKTYLPYVQGNTGGFRNSALLEQTAFYGGVEGWDNQRKMTTTTTPFKEVKMEASPLSTVKESAGVGESWKMSTGRTTKSDWRPNDANEVPILIFDPSTQSLSIQGYYPAGELVVQQATDGENKKAWIYVDRTGLTIYKKTPIDSLGTDYLEHYSVYDDYGQLLLVIPPKAYDAVKAANWTLSATVRDEQCYLYRYDARGRVIYKKVAGSAPVEMVYNRRNQLVLSQNGIQRLKATPEWSFVKYDEEGRSLVSGLLKDTRNRADLQSLLDSQTILFEKEENNSIGYSNTAFPILGANTEVLSVSYYDDYDFDNNNTIDASYQASGLSPEPVATQERIRGLKTGSKVKVMKENVEQWIWSSVFYDERQRVIQTQTDNHLQGKDISTMQMDYMGKVLKTHTRHGVVVANNTNTQLITQRYTYDHLGRVQEEFQQINSQPEERLSKVHYNALGQVVSKEVGKDAQGKPLQKMYYRYNILGWQTHLNNVALSKEASEDPTPLFGLEYRYENVSGIVGAKARYNGNLTAQIWKSGLDGVERRYTYEYDYLDRLKNAHYSDNENLTGTHKRDYFEGNLTYDKAGNILSLERKGIVDVSMGQGVYGFTDRLTYQYQANSHKLLNVLDAENDLTRMKVGDFRDQNKKATTNVDDYSYDVGGSLTKDANKNISSITYNHLDKPTKILLSNGNYIEYLYDAVGIKLQKRVVEIATSKTKITDYVGGFSYENEKLSFVETSQGRAMANYVSGGSVSFRYEYYYTDHLGNLRMVFREAATHNYATGLDGANDEGGFRNIPETKIASQGRLNTNASETNGTKSIGVWKTMAVSKGDKLSAKVWARYPTPSSTPQNRNFSVAPTLTYLGAGGVPTGNDATNPANLANWALGVSIIPNTSTSSSLPKAELKAVLYDEAGNYLTEQYISMTSSSQNSWVEYALNWDIPQNGLLQVMSANSSDATVYFDDMSVELAETMIVQETHYYPFGGVLKGIGKEGNNKYLYNGGTEREDSFDIGLDETDFRRYDANLGRFTGIDALAEKYKTLTPYHYSYNDPINFHDPSGLEAEESISSMNDYLYNNHIAMLRAEIDGRRDEAMFEMEQRIEEKEKKKAKGSAGGVVSTTAKGPCVECKKAKPNAKKGTKHTVRVSNFNGWDNYVYIFDGKNWVIDDYYLEDGKESIRGVIEDTGDIFVEAGEQIVNPFIDSEEEYQGRLKDDEEREYYKENYDEIKTIQRLTPAAVFGESLQGEFEKNPSRVAKQFGIDEDKWHQSEGGGIKDKLKSHLGFYSAKISKLYGNNPDFGLAKDGKTIVFKPMTGPKTGKTFSTGITLATLLNFID